LPPGVELFVAGDSEKLSSAVLDRSNLGGPALYFRIPGDDGPSLGGYDRDPLVILDISRRYRAWRPGVSLDPATRVAGVGHVPAETSHDLGQSEGVRVDVEADRHSSGHRPLIGDGRLHQLNRQVEVLGHPLRRLSCIDQLGEGLSTDPPDARRSKGATGVNDNW
jgi:hypothetical protein